MSTFDLFSWLTAAASLTATVLNVRKDRRCFHVWCFTNVGWCGIDASFGIWSQAALHACYAALAIYGVMTWKTQST